MFEQLFLFVSNACCSKRKKTNESFLKKTSVQYEISSESTDDFCEFTIPTLRNFSKVSFANVQLC
jgi:hypothetical protein